MRSHESNIPTEPFLRPTEDSRDLHDHFAGRDLRLIEHRQRKAAGEQLSFDDLGGWRFFAIITNIPPLFGLATDIEHRHRLRGGAPQEAIRQLKEDFGMNNAPCHSFMANWLWWLAASLSPVLARVVSHAWRRGKHLRNRFFNVPVRIVRSARRLHLRLPRAHRHAHAFLAALGKLRALPTFAPNTCRPDLPPRRHSHARGHL
jgi:hypothetical protein